MEVTKLVPRVSYLPTLSGRPWKRDWEVTKVIAENEGGLTQRSMHTQELQKTNMPSIQQSFYFLNARTFCAVCLHNRTQCIDSFSLLLQRYIKGGIDTKNPVIFRFFFETERTQLNAVHA